MEKSSQLPRQKPKTWTMTRWRTSIQYLERVWKQQCVGVLHETVLLGDAKRLNLILEGGGWLDCESDGGADGGRARLLSKPRTPSRAEWERHVVSHLPFRDWRRHCVAGSFERRYQKHPGQVDQFPLVCSDFGFLSGDATPMLVAKN